MRKRRKYQGQDPSKVPVNSNENFTRDRENVSKIECPTCQNSFHTKAPLGFLQKCCRKIALEQVVLEAPQVAGLRQINGKMQEVTQFLKPALNIKQLLGVLPDLQNSIKEPISLKVLQKVLKS